MKFWIKDPKDNNPSVSLTLMMYSFIGVLSVNILVSLGKLPNTGIMSEIFYATAALYFGRRSKMANVSFEDKVDNESK